MSRIEEAMEKASQLRGMAGQQPMETRDSRDPKPGQPAPVLAPVRQGNLPDQPRQEALRVKDPTVVTINEPLSPIAEEYRKLKEMVIKATKGDEFLNTIMVTSALASEGKSLTSVNLAVSLAQEYDHTVLLVDADLRRPTCARYLDIEPKYGLTDCLMDGVSVADALVKTGIDKLTLLPAGKSVPNPGELFSSAKMREFLKEMKHRYPDRYIIIDTPPVLPFAETRTIGSIVDGVLLVVKEKSSSLSNIKEALASLKGAHLLGVVYNDAAIHNMSHGYGYYYNNDYYRARAANG